MKKNRAVMTILGTISGNEAHYTFSSQLANYTSQLSKEHYANMFPLLLDTFAQTHDIIALSTDKAKEIQHSFDPHNSAQYVMCEDNEPFMAFFGKMNAVLENSDYEEILVDVSHGFRHYPLLALVALIAQNMKHNKRITHIFYAKVIQEKQHYEIIDLYEYLDIANVANMLAGFKENYTVSAHLVLKNPRFVKLSSHLNSFSHHILANSLTTLFEGKQPLLQTIIKELTSLENDPSTASLATLIDDVRQHLEKIYKLKNTPISVRLWGLSTYLVKRGYVLNALTLIHEAFAYYALEYFSRYAKEALKEVLTCAEQQAKTEKNRFTYYDLTGGVLKVFRFSQEEYQGFLKFDTKLECKKYRLKEALEEAYTLKTTLLQTSVQHFTTLLKDSSNLRNNLAHANAGKALDETKTRVKDLVNDFEKLCIKNDIFHVRRTV